MSFRRIALAAALLAAAPSALVAGSLWARASQLVAHASITLFRGPGEGFPQLGTLVTDSQVDVLWCNADATWCLVQGTDARGWAPSAALMSRKSANSSGLAGSETTPAAANGLGAPVAKSLSSASGAASATAGALSSTTAGAVAAGTGQAAAGAVSRLSPH